MQRHHPNVWCFRRSITSFITKRWERVTCTTCLYQRSRGQ